jgi:hypothetical protein
MSSDGDQVIWPGPRTDPGPLDVPLLMRVLARIEGDGHRRGWDRNPATLWAVYEHGDGHTHRLLAGMAARHQPVFTARDARPLMVAPCRVGAYAAAPLLPPAALNTPQGPPWQALRAFALNTAYGTDSSDEVKRGMLRLPGIRAIAFSVEGYLRVLPKEAMAVEAERQIDYSTQPDSIETRNVTAIDLYGRIHLVERTRGDRPTTIIGEGGAAQVILAAGAADDSPIAADDAVSYGDCSTGLRILRDAIMGETPAQDAAFDARYPSLAHVVRSGRYDREVAERAARGGLIG